MSAPLAAEVRAELLTAVRGRSSTIVARWQQAIALTGMPELSDEEVCAKLQELLDQIVALLNSERVDNQRAQAIGATLVQLRYNAPDSLARTIETLTVELTSNLSDPTTCAALPYITRIVGLLAAGFSTEVRSIVLAEQEQIRRALLAARQQQEAVIRAQEAALDELSTPLIPVSETIVAMPLVGMIDARRARQVLEVLLDGITARNARIAILDITGVPVVDTLVADGLMNAAQAVRLMGARIVITGIRPEVAQTLVALGIDFSGLVTRSTLQDGISYALGQ